MFQARRQSCEEIRNVVIQKKKKEKEKRKTRDHCRDSVVIYAVDLGDPHPSWRACSSL